jgi:hypothetical protein
MVMGQIGPGTKNDCAAEGQNHMREVSLLNQCHRTEECSPGSRWACDCADEGQQQFTDQSQSQLRIVRQKYGHGF